MADLTSGPTASYDEAARERFWVEASKDSPRTEFERDRARVVHSASLRRLAAKTQVVGPQSDDFVRNRLTHSLEVAQVARDLGHSIGCDPDVVETAALAHDLGHPPFGHNGERALDEVAKACGGFEGNAQSLRVLTRLEAKTLDGDGRSLGLNLTRATLDACTKYPWARDEAPAAYGPSSAKFGVYEDDREVFDWMRQAAPPARRCVEAQVMDFSDDVAYSVHDLEDGIVAGRILLDWLADPAERRAVWQTARDWYLPDAPDDAFDDAMGRLWKSTPWPALAYDGTRRALAGMKNLTSHLIGRFCVAVQQATQEAYGEAPLTRYAANLVVPDETLLEITALKAIAAHYVMRADDRQPVLQRQRDIITELVSLIRLRGAIDPSFSADFEAARNDAEQLRVIIDQVASLTDASALAWHARLT